MKLQRACFNPRTCRAASISPDIRATSRKSSRKSSGTHGGILTPRIPWQAALTRARPSGVASAIREAEIMRSRFSGSFHAFFTAAEMRARVAGFAIFFWAVRDIRARISGSKHAAFLAADSDNNLIPSASAHLRTQLPETPSSLAISEAGVVGAKTRIRSIFSGVYFFIPTSHSRAHPYQNSIPCVNECYIVT